VEDRVRDRTHRLELSGCAKNILKAGPACPSTQTRTPEPQSAGSLDLQRLYRSGRYWARTSDLLLVRSRLWIITVRRCASEPHIERLARPESRRTGSLCATASRAKDHNGQNGASGRPGASGAGRGERGTATRADGANGKQSAAGGDQNAAGGNAAGPKRPRRSGAGGAAGQHPGRDLPGPPVPQSAGAGSAKTPSAAPKPRAEAAAPTPTRPAQKKPGG